MTRNLRLTTLALVVLGLLVAPVWANEADGRRKLDAAQRDVLAEASAWSAIMPLADGSLGIVFQKAKPLEDIDAVNVSMEWTRSTDGGRTWSEPVMISRRLGPNDKLFAERPEGGFVVFQDRNEALGQLPSGRIVVSFCRLNYYYKADGSEDNRPNKSWPHDNQGVFVCVSDDLGKTWTEARQIDTGPLTHKTLGISPQWRIITLKDGTALMSLYGSRDADYDGPIELPENSRILSAVIRSTDNGQTWGDMSLIAGFENELPYEETCLCRVSDDRLLAHVRRPDGRVDQYVSTDQGRTWQGPEFFTEPGQQPGGAFQLSSGRLIGTWGNRRAPYYGAMAMLSEDGGRTWQYDRRVLLAGDASGEGCGYANGAQAGDGTIVVTYYDMPPSENYRAQWTRSKTYTIRFTEEQFLDAVRADP